MEELIVHINDSCLAYNSVHDFICYVKLVKLVKHKQEKQKQTGGEKG